jgi:fibronectin-binding autotransporter adhesin
MASSLGKHLGYVRSNIDTRKAFRVLAGAMGGIIPLMFQHGSTAATLTWDPGTTPLTPSGGTGTWDLTTTSNWSNGSADSQWVDTNGSSGVAVFAGTAGTVTENSTLGALALNFETTGYTISGSGTISLGGASNNNGFFLASGVSATIDNNVTWRGNSPTIGITPGSTLTFGGNFVGSATSKPTFFGGALVLNGDESNFAGTLEMNTSNAAAATAGQPTIPVSPSGTIYYGATTGTFGTSVAIFTIAEGATLQANTPLNMIGNFQLSGGVGVTNSYLAGTANISIANLYDNNTNGELYDGLAGGATGPLLTIGSSSANFVCLGGTSASTVRMFSIGGTGNTVINATIEDVGTINGAAGANTGKDNFNWNDSGTLTINTPSLYGGGTFLSNGTTVLGVGNALPVGTSVTMGSLTGTNATLDLDGNSQTVASIGVATGSVLSLTASTSGANSAILKFATTPSTGMAIGQTISNPSLPSGTTILGIVSQTNGETDLTMSNIASAAISGPVAFSAGAATASNQVIGNSSTSSNATLSLSGASTFAGTIQDTLGLGNQQTAVAVLSTGSLNLTGTNSYTGNTTVTGGGTLQVSPGGTLGTTNVNVDASSILNLDGGTLDYDLLASGLTSTITDLGTLNVAGTNIIDVFSTDSSLTPGDYTLISNPTGFTDTPTSFEFSNMTTSETLVVGGTPYTLTLTDPSTAVTLSVSPVPEPASLALLGLASLSILRRKRR